MSPNPQPERYIGLDVHKHYLIATGVDRDQQVVYGPQRVPLQQLESWRRKQLTAQDALVLEMTTNTWQVYDDLAPHVQSVTVVHPPQLALITRAQVMTDKIAALVLARLHAAGLIPPVWIPGPEVREQRALVAQRAKLVRLSTQAKNRLHAVLHRHPLAPPEGNPFTAEQRAWWLALPITVSERARVQCDLETLAFARAQVAVCTQALTAVAAADARVPRLIQLPGFSLVTAMTVRAARGTIERFAEAKQLVGYAGLGMRVHASGLTHRSGRITKAGRRDLRAALVEAAQSAANFDPHWQAVLARLEPRLGRNKAIVAIARKLLVVVWHVLTQQAADRFATPERVARKLMQHTYRLGKANRRAEQSTAAYVREQLDRLGLGAELTEVRLSQHQKPIALPPSRLTAARD